jgi:hypothetical protein
MIGGVIVVIIIITCVLMFSGSTSDTSSSPITSLIDCLGDWETCSAPCGDGTQKYKITTSKKNGGKSCTFEADEVKPCKIQDYTYSWGCYWCVINITI